MFWLIKQSKQQQQKTKSESDISELGMESNRATHRLYFKVLFSSEKLQENPLARGFCFVTFDISSVAFTMLQEVFFFSIVLSWGIWNFAFTLIVFKTELFFAAGLALSHVQIEKYS